MMENEEAYARRQSYNEIWDSLYSGSIDYLNEHFSELAPKLLEFLLLSVFNEEVIDIGICQEKRRFCSILPYDQYNYDKQLLLKLYIKSEFQLELILDDDNDEPRSYVYTLRPEDLQIIPVGLRDVMHSVLKAKDSTQVIANTLK